MPLLFIEVGFCLLSQQPQKSSICESDYTRGIYWYFINISVMKQTVVICWWMGYIWSNIGDYLCDIYLPYRAAEAKL